MRAGASPRFATRPRRRDRRTPTNARAHIALRTVTRSPVSPPNTAAESANRTDASPRFATRPCRRDRRTPTGSSEAAFDMRTDASPASPRGHAAAAGERRQALERTSRCALALPQNTAAESANRTDASPASPRGHVAATGERRQPLERTSPCAPRRAPLSPRRIPPRNRRTAQAHRPALPRGHAAAASETDRLPQTSAAFNAPGRIAPLCHAAMPPRQANADRLERTRPSICARTHRPALPRGHAAAAGERRQPLERASRCAP